MGIRPRALPKRNNDPPRHALLKPLALLAHRRWWMSPTRKMTRSPLAVAGEALSTAQAVLPPYSSKFSRRDYTQHELFALLVLREFLKTGVPGRLLCPVTTAGSILQPGGFSPGTHPGDCHVHARLL